MWITLLCKALGIAETRTVRLALSLWAVSEGCPVEWNNPLGCTRAELTSFAATGAGVQTYHTLQEGIDATARELSTTPYTGVVAALAASADLEDIWTAINVSPWRSGAQEGHYPLELFHAWQPDPPVGPLEGEVDLD